MNQSADLHEVADMSAGYQRSQVKAEQGLGVESLCQEILNLRHDKTTRF